MQRHGDDVRDQDKGDAYRPVRKCAPHQTVAEPKPIAGDESHLGRTHPRCDAASAFWSGDEVMNGEYVEVEASDAHHRVVGVLLVLNRNVGKGVPDEGEVVICRMERLDE